MIVGPGAAAAGGAGGATMITMIMTITMEEGAAGSSATCLGAWAWGGATMTMGAVTVVEGTEGEAMGEAMGGVMGEAMTIHIMEAVMVVGGGFMMTLTTVVSHWS